MLKYVLVSTLLIWTETEGDALQFVPRVSLPMETKAACLEGKAKVIEIMGKSYPHPMFAGHLLKCVQVNRTPEEFKAA